MPRIPAPAVILAAVALALVCVSAFDALSVGWQIRTLAAHADGAALRAGIDELTARNLRGDTAGIALGLVLGAVAAVLLHRRRRAGTATSELERIVDMALDAFVGVGPDGRIVRWNAQAEQLFGWTREEAVGRPVTGTAFELGRGDLRALAGAPTELTAWHRDGTEFPVEVALSVDGDSVYAFVRDISRRRRSERRERAIHLVIAALAEAETPAEAGRGVLEVLCASYGFDAGTTWTLDAKRDVLALTWAYGASDWRATCEGTTLALGEGLPGEAWATGGVAYRAGAAGLESDPRDIAGAGMRSAIAVPLLVEGEVVGVVELLAGRARPVEAWLLDDLAAVQQVLGSYVERRRAREASERAKREFLTLVSHELRTPLTSIMGYVQMLRTRVAGEAEQRSVEIIGRNADRLHRLVGDLLLAAEIARGHLGLEPAPTAVAELVREAVDAARPAAGARSVSILVAADEDVPEVPGDAGRLAQVLDNLLSNAIKFSHPGGRVDVAVRAADDVVTVAVRDRGIGVAAAEVERITTQFFRAGTAQSAQVPGMGLGLALSKAIVEGHGGTLSFDSVEGAGTVVTIALPVDPATPAALAA